MQGKFLTSLNGLARFMRNKHKGIGGDLQSEGKKHKAMHLCLNEFIFNFLLSFFPDCIYSFARERECASAGRNRGRRTSRFYAEWEPATGLYPSTLSS